MIKKTKSIIGISLVCTALLASCDLDRLPLDGPSSETFPSNKKEAEMGLLGAYKGLSLLDASSTPIWHVMDNITDIGYARPGNNYTSPITSSITTDNALATKPWAAHYKTIARVHDVLDRLTEIQHTMAEGDYKKIDAELRFIRAYCYSQLIELYGDVPLLKNALKLGDTLPHRTAKKEVENFIIDEMTAIADNLPTSQAGVRFSRASSIAAYMLKARVALYGKQYKVAATAAEKAITLSNGIHSLTPFDNSIAFANQTHDKGEPEVANIFGHKGFESSKEWIWVVEYNRNISDNVHNQLYYISSRLGKGVCYWGPTQNFIDSFQDLQGAYITESSIYNAAKPFENRDPRLDLYTVRPHARFMGFQFEPHTSFSRVNNYWPVINGTAPSPTLQANADATNAYRSFSGYLWRKHTDLTDFATTSVSGFSDLNVGVFRYAELLLIYAEAKIEDNSIDNTVYDAINQIRKRAKMPDLPASLSQNQLRTALRYERKVELANDGLRWYDLRRWGIAKEVMNGYIYLNRAANSWDKNVLTRIDEHANPVYNHANATKSFGTQEVVYKENKDEYWPISAQELDANKNLKQNPGY
ncbi:RagB/SusD family nutrient uptake outer membrane protein [Sphingobacterium psychroaquaticum]|uniref:RagB/SusD family nutrient uptake outer membrane protein n=1 Tax=Sphingobacterium psychroaquaticum TaxID=561061 RepID=UPI00106AEDE9|nr:RagB/SusD family nutrient uptake outer membrane protein [Sphingobacterium psychroaquaticum]QBQ41690.1 RagB/SusD family nutrient uptake outer membrane protein [Sphingobacterium psychroaquaticum]